MALPMALILAILYFGLIELLLIDASRELEEARRFRARIVALTLAENGAELAAKEMVTPNKLNQEMKAAIADGKMFGRLDKRPAEGGYTFDIKATGDATGVGKGHAEVRLLGTIDGSAIRIDYALHTQ